MAACDRAARDTNRKIRKAMRVNGDLIMYLLSGGIDDKIIKKSVLLQICNGDVTDL